MMTQGLESKALDPHNVNFPFWNKDMMAIEIQGIFSDRCWVGDA